MSPEKSLHRRARDSAAAVPSALRRVLRERVRLLAALLMLAVVAVSAGVHNGALAALNASLDEHWRGDYDLLITADPAPIAVEGMVPPRAIGATGGPALTLDDVEQIRSHEGVELAAPLAKLIIPGSPFLGDRVELVRALAGGPRLPTPQLYHAELHYFTDDGFGQRLAYLDGLDFAMDIADLPFRWYVEPEDAHLLGKGVECYINGVQVDLRSEEAESCRWQWRDVVQVRERSFGYDARDGQIMLGLPGFPAARQIITLIDPVAEQAMMGARGAFLEPLLNWQPQGDAAGVMSAEEMAQIQLPVLVAETAPTQLLLRVGLEEFGPAETTSDGFNSLIVPNLSGQLGSGVPLGSSEVAASRLLQPLSPGTVGVPWPDTMPAAANDASIPDAAEQASAEALPLGAENTPIEWFAAIQGPDYTVEDGVIVVRGLGFLEPSRELPSRADQNPFDLRGDDSGKRVGNETMYTKAVKPFKVPKPSFVADSGWDVLPTLIPVGGFEQAQLDAAQQQPGYAPTGVYGSYPSLLIADGAGQALPEPLALQPALSGHGLLDSGTTVLGDIRRAGILGKDAIVHAVRVRVAEVDGYTSAGKARIVEVADGLREQGYTVTIMSGSSPTQAEFLVRDYAFGTDDPSSQQRVGMLGTVSEPWSELGAAARAEAAIGSSSTALLLLAVLATGALMGTVQLVGVGRRRLQAVTLKELGWTRGVLLRWWLSEELLIWGGFAVVSILALLVAAQPALTWPAVLAGAAVLVATSALSVLAALRSLRIRTVRTERVQAHAVRERALRARRAAKRAGAEAARNQRRRAEFAELPKRRLLRLRRRVRSLSRFSLRQLVVHRATALAQLGAIAIVGLAASGLLLSIVHGTEAAGESALSKAVALATLWPQLLLGALTLVAALVLNLLVRRAERGRRAAQWQLLRAAGWTGANRNRVLRREAVLIGLAGIALALASAWALSQLFGLPVELMLIATGVASTAVAVILSALQGKETLS